MWNRQITAARNTHSNWRHFVRISFVCSCSALKYLKQTFAQIIWMTRNVQQENYHFSGLSKLSFHISVFCERARLCAAHGPLQVSKTGEKKTHQIGRALSDTFDEFAIKRGARTTRKKKLTIDFSNSKNRTRKKVCELIITSHEINVILVIRCHTLANSRSKNTYRRRRRHASQAIRVQTLADRAVDGTISTNRNPARNVFQ